MSIVDRSLNYPGGPVGVLLIHGLGGTPLELKAVARGLARRGYTVHCCQLAGHCGTEADLLATNRRDWTKSVSDAFDRLKQECTTVLVGGLSMGAILSLYLAAERGEEVDGLLLYAPTLTYDGWSIPWYAFLLRWFIATPVARAYRFVERHPYGIKDEAIRARIAFAIQNGDSATAGLLGTPSLSLREMWLLNDEVKRRLADITRPALIIHPREDDISSLDNAVFLQKRLGGLVDLLVLDDSYHIITVDRQRHLVTDRSAAFVEWIVSRPKEGAPAETQALSAA